MRSGDGPYRYEVRAGHPNQPVVCVTWYNAIRFANWLTNGQGKGDTEAGTYSISGSGPTWAVDVPVARQRARWAAAEKRHYLVPSENEWYKTAYFKRGRRDAGYWDTPTQSNVGPSPKPRGDAGLGQPPSHSSRGYAVTEWRAPAAA